jgi:hypothetical protein
MKGRTMTPSLKTLGLTLVAVLAVGAVVASAASAVPFKFKSEKASTILTGKQHAIITDDIKVDDGTIRCPQVTYVGQQNAMETTEFEVAPTYTGCTIGPVKVTIDMNGCKYRFKSGEIEGGNFEGSVDIVCPGTNIIEATGFGCIVKVFPQNGLKKVTYTNLGVGTTQENTVDLLISGFEYEEAGFLCKNDETGVTNNGTYEGFILLTGEDAFSKHIGIWVE